MSHFIGPTLPRHLHKRLSTEDLDNTDLQNESHINSQNIEIGTSLPPHCDGNNVTSDSSADKKEARSKILFQAENKLTIVPSLPSDFQNKCSRKSVELCDEENAMIGPELPKHLKHLSDDDDCDDSNNSSVNVCAIGPKIPPFLLTKPRKHEVSKKSPSDTGIIGPSLPAHLQAKLIEELPTVVEGDNVTEKKSNPVIGPVLPSHIKLGGILDESEKDCDDVYGPALPPGFTPKTVVTDLITTHNDNTESDDEDMGPLPEGNGARSEVQRQLEIRAMQLRESMRKGETSISEEPKQRESWMLELPADRAPELGLKPRQFRVRAGPETGDRSVWTDTPADRERKKNVPKAKFPDKGALERQAIAERDKIMQQLSEQHSGKRGSRSLMDMHEEKIKEKKAKESGEVKERRPFSREVDLQVNRFDEAQKQSILKKAQLLNDRFSAGQSKFL